MANKNCMRKKISKSSHTPLKAIRQLVANN